MSRSKLRRRAQTKNRNPENKRDIWNKISLTTPLVLGVLASIIGGIFTYLHNKNEIAFNGKKHALEMLFNKTQAEHKKLLAKIDALEKFRSLVSSTKEKERTFGRFVFEELGYATLAVCRTYRTNRV